MRLSAYYNIFTPDYQNDILGATTVERIYLSKKLHSMVETYIVYLLLLLLLLLLLFSIYFRYLTYFQSDPYNDLIL